MDYQRPSMHSDSVPPPQRSGSGSAVNSNNQGDYSDNTYSNNTIDSWNTIYNNYYDSRLTNSLQSQPEILQSLYTSKYEEHRDRIRDPVEGTCTWVTEHPKYKDWLKGGASGILWLSADPGCGKSVIASFLIKHLESRMDTIVCYFFFKDDSEEQRSATFALSAILHQIFKQRTHLVEFVKEEYKAKGREFTDEVSTLWNILVKVMTEGQCGQVICVVDALDECEERTLDQFVRRAIGLPHSQTPDIPLKFLFTGRPYHKIERELSSPATTIRLKGEEEVNAITTDVNRVIDAGVKKLELYWGLVGKLEYLRNLLKFSADRTFLWVSLVLDILEDSEDCSEEEFTNIVSTAPHDIAELYTRILNKSRYPDKARKILNIVVAAARPLTLREMHAAFGIRREHRSVKDLGDLPAGFDRSVKNWCGLFVRIIDSKIYLVHQTAKEFLTRGSLSGQGSWQYSLCSMDSNFLLADICISYLSLEDFGTDQLVGNPFGGRYVPGAGFVTEYALLSYAATHWVHHFRDSHTRQKELVDFTRLICEGGSRIFMIWFERYWADNHSPSLFPDDFTHLMVASWLGQGAVVEKLLQDGGDIDGRSKRFGTALNIAALRKEKEIAKMLVQSSLKADLGGKEYNILHTKRSELRDLRNLYSEYPAYADVIRFLESFCIPDASDPDTLTPHDMVSS